MEAHEVSEQVEHAAHGAHGGGPLSKYVGVTIAVLGVLLAFEAALVGGARTELIATMLEQTNSSLTYTSVSTKYRMLQAQLQQLHALMPDAKELQRTREELRALVKDLRPDEERVVGVVRLETRKILNTVTPSKPDLLRFASLVRAHERERQAALSLVESYEPAIKAQSEAAEHYEWAQLAAEIGIVVASIALLLSNRRAWLAAAALGTVSLGLVGWSYAATHTRLTQAAAGIQSARDAFALLDDEKASRAGDEALLRDIEATPDPVEGSPGGPEAGPPTEQRGP